MLEVITLQKPRQKHRRAHWMRVGRALGVVQEGKERDHWVHEEFPDYTHTCWMAHRSYDTALRHWVSMVVRVEDSLLGLERAYAKAQSAD